MNIRARGGQRQAERRPDHGQLPDKYSGRKPRAVQARPQEPIEEEPAAPQRLIHDAATRVRIRPEYGFDGMKSTGAAPMAIPPANVLPRMAPWSKRASQGGPLLLLELGLEIFGGLW